MVHYGMVWVLTIDGCSLQMGAKDPSVERPSRPKAGLGLVMMMMTMMIMTLTISKTQVASGRQWNR